ncbi:pimeloyl-[acyl-carrier protein] methyl ester esterase [Sinosporangium album]|uniref:Pimeloyl-[acyl-carrier protein] methyl ester esterase n=1 Tax=Sinosporangium album TaxID=504805 RepID=A0A1G7ZU07_9ACTN|nr:alpha/beta hydrolase [Sinosporangium album]SDH12199.1 pimeloyl-[acyl-carrier protein] methyl ester esterase [Sinosporangium album]
MSESISLGTVRRTSARGMVYGDRGSGAPIVLVHGWCLSGRMWTYLEEALAVRHRVINVDLAGFGRSDHLAGPYTLARFADDLDDLLRELSLTDVTVVGFAFGAAVAMELAERGPGGVGRLVLIGVPSAGHAAYAKMPAAMRRDWLLFADRSAAAICGRPLSEPARRWLADMFAATPLPVAIETCAELARFDPLERRGEVHQPALLVHGADDAIVPVEVSEASARRMKGATVAMVPDSGHLVPMDQPAALAELVLDFAARNLP